MDSRVPLTGLSVDRWRKPQSGVKHQQVRFTVWWVLARWVATHKTALYVACQAGGIKDAPARVQERLQRTTRPEGAARVPLPASVYSQLPLSTTLILNCFQTSSPREP